MDQFVGAHARAKAWTSMRVLMRFTSAQIEATAEIREDNIRKYIRELIRSGHLRLAQERVSGRAGSFNLYALARNTGPLAPIARDNGQLFDPNTNETFGDVQGSTSVAGGGTPGATEALGATDDRLD